MLTQEDYNVHHQLEIPRFWMITSKNAATSIEEPGNHGGIFAALDDKTVWMKQIYTRVV